MKTAWIKYKRVEVFTEGSHLELRLYTRAGYAHSRTTVRITNEEHGTISKGKYVLKYELAQDGTALAVAVYKRTLFGRWRKIFQGLIG